MSANRVLVVESGAKTRTIRGFLGGDYDVVASGGHIVDLPDDSLGIAVDDEFAYDVVPIGRQDGDAVESMKAKLAEADEVYLATDPDREGEAIAADIRDYAVPHACPVHRIEFNAIVYPAVRDALDNPRDVNENRVAAQRARRSLDRLIGFILSSITKFDPTGPHTPSVGRVQSPAVRLVVDREQEIEAFDVRRYWTVQAEVGTEAEAFTATLDGEWDDFDAAKSVVENLQETGEFAVTDCDVDPESTQNPLPPYTTDALQNDADYLLNFDPERTMELAQQLYEGVDLEIDGESETRALITYMRTDSTRVSPSALNLAKATLSEREELGEDQYQGRTWQAGEQAQDAHEAIRPTHPDEPAVWPENLEGVLEDPLLDLYRLIYKRFLASQMIPATYRTTTLDLAAGEYIAEAVGHELRDPGFLVVWRDVYPEHGREETHLPTPEVGTALAVDRAWPEPEETSPPPRYREGSLISELKERGIGRPSTYGDILTKIKRGPGGFGYVRKAGNTLQPTEKGEALIAFLDDRFPRIVDYEYTARMEEDLDRIESGDLSYTEYLKNEFSWLEGPYAEAVERGWLDSDRPTPAQLEYLDSLAEETGMDVPSDVRDSKAKTSQWIEKLLDEIDAHVQLTDITETAVNGVNVYRFRLYFNESLPDEEYEYLRDMGLKYKAGSKDQRPAFQYQRQDRSVVESIRQELEDRYVAGEALDEFEVEVGGNP